MQKLFFTRTFLAFCGIFHGKKSEKIVHFSRHRNSFSRPKKTLLVPTHLCIFFCLFLCLTVFRSARMSSHMKKKVNFLFFGFIYFITSFARNFCELFYWMCNWIPRRGVQVMQTCISFKFREYQAYHPLPTKQGLKVIVSEHSNLAAKIAALCKVTKWQVQNLR